MGKNEKGEGVWGLRTKATAGTGRGAASRHGHQGQGKSKPCNCHIFLRCDSGKVPTACQKAARGQFSCSTFLLPDQPAHEHPPTGTNSTISAVFLFGNPYSNVFLVPSTFPVSVQLLLPSDWRRLQALARKENAQIMQVGLGVIFSDGTMLVAGAEGLVAPARGRLTSSRWWQLCPAWPGRLRSRALPFSPNAKA